MSIVSYLGTRISLKEYSCDLFYIEELKPQHREFMLNKLNRKYCYFIGEPKELGLGFYTDEDNLIVKDSFTNYFKSIITNDMNFCFYSFWLGDENKPIIKEIDIKLQDLNCQKFEIEYEWLYKITT